MGLGRGDWLFSHFGVETNRKSPLDEFDKCYIGSSCQDARDGLLNSFAEISCFVMVVKPVSMIPPRKFANYERRP